MKKIRRNVIIIRFRSSIGDENPQFFDCQEFVRSLWFSYRYSGTFPTYPYITVDFRFLSPLVKTISTYIPHRRHALCLERTVENFDVAYSYFSITISFSRSEINIKLNNTTIYTATTNFTCHYLMNSKYNSYIYRHLCNILLCI